MLKSALIDYLNDLETDDEILAMFKQIRFNQANGLTLQDSIIRVVKGSTNIMVEDPTSRRSKNAVEKLARKHKGLMLEYKKDGFGYGKISKILAQRNIYNKKTGKAYSRKTISDALKLIKKEGDKNAQL